MHSELREYVQVYKRANNDKRFDLIKMFNKLSFVEQLKEEKVPNNEITMFFKYICEQQILNDEPLMTSGYIDMLEFARDHKLFSKVEKNRSK